MELRSLPPFLQRFRPEPAGQGKLFGTLDLPVEGLDATSIQLDLVIAASPEIVQTVVTTTTWRPSRQRQQERSDAGRQTQDTSSDLPSQSLIA